jgi:hypothetical protein
MKIYLASSWRNADQPAAVAYLRAQGHDVYDFRHPCDGNSGFSWVNCQVGNPNQWNVADWLSALKTEPAQIGFDLDMAALRACDACVLLLPCGRSAHLELGWAVGAGKTTIVLCEMLDEPELMYLMCSKICTSIVEVAKELAACTTN